MISRSAMAAGAGLAAMVVASFLAVAPASAAQAQTYRTSEEEFEAAKRAARPPAVPTNWTGIWRRVATARGAGIFCFDQDNGSNPKIPGYCASGAKLTPKYQQAYDKKVADIAAGIEWDRLSWCLPTGMPRWMTEPSLREFIVTPTQTWLILEQLQEIRRIYTDGRGHIPADVAIPLWMGDSVGFWDGDTLVIHTNNLKAGQYQRGQPDYSFKTTTVERMRMVSPDTIETVITVYDPDSLVEPYKATFRYQRVADPALRLSYNSCEEGNNAVRGPDGSTTFVLPGEPGYRDPTTFGIPEVALDSLPMP